MEKGFLRFVHFQHPPTPHIHTYIKELRWTCASFNTLTSEGREKNVGVIDVWNILGI